MELGKGQPAERVVATHSCKGSRQVADVGVGLKLLMSVVATVSVAAHLNSPETSPGRNHGRPASGRFDYCVISTSLNPNLTWVGAEVLPRIKAKLQKMNILAIRHSVHATTISLQIFPNTRHCQRVAMMWESLTFLYKCRGKDREIEVSKRQLAELTCAHHVI